MPGIPLVARETTYTRSQMCRQDSRADLSAEEEIAAEASLSTYCKPVELYNILQRRALGNPSFLQRCLRYKIQSKHKRRIQMTVSVGILSNGLQNQSSYPLYILLARPVANLAAAEYSAVYRFKRAYILANSANVEGMNRAQSNFILPEIDKLDGDVKFGSLAVLIVSCADFAYPFGATISKNIEGACLLGTISMELLCISMEKSPKLHLGERAEVISNVDMRSHYIKDLEDMKNRLKEIEEEAGALREMQAKVEKEMGVAQDSTSAASQAEKEEVDSRSIYVGNVDYACTPEEVQQHFQSCGTVNRVTILTDKFGQPNGFAYVEFVEVEAVPNAVLLNESELHGRQLKVSAKRTNVPGMKQYRGRRPNPFFGFGPRRPYMPAPFFFPYGYGWVPRYRRPMRYRPY